MSNLQLSIRLNFYISAGRLAAIITQNNKNESTAKQGTLFTLKYVHVLKK